jgi:hypothetical protein
VRPVRAEVKWKIEGGVPAGSLLESSVHGQGDARVDTWAR